ncbi:unnamed protein product [Ixodes hexagonus]
MPGPTRHAADQARHPITTPGLDRPTACDADIARTWVCEKWAGGEELDWSLRACCCCLCAGRRRRRRSGADIIAGQTVATNHDSSCEAGKLEPASDMFLVYLRVFAEKCGLLDFLKLFVFSLASRKPATGQHEDAAEANGSAGPALDEPCSGGGQVRVRMRADAEGRFGFNVKGGADQGLPILVSRVVPNTPADTCLPRLNEGDQVLLINGKDVQGLSHDQVVVKLIRAPKDNGELVLTVKPQVYAGEQIEEPDFQYIPDSTVPARGPRSGALAESMLLLAEGLESGATIAQFEQLYRKKPDMTMKCARLPCNLSKNRYRDISPYDATRVILQEGTSGDYVNASYVNMNIPTSGIVNRYIATQGPLPNTTIDFWEMVWEQQCTLVVMLTTLVERGRVKCHKYWPDLYETDTYGHLQVSCVRQKETPSFAFREFTLINTRNREERHISHMQYLAWPDHGVPDEASDFLHFVQRVRRSRDGMVEPTVVHCSAGIGRTGVLVLMETAMCLIEAHEPVYPLDLTRDMRDQRAMLIQTPSQYKFVCEAILQVYNEGTVKPLPEYQR